MILESIELIGFRGLNRLALQLENSNVLMGENAWGKTSLLDALTLLLSPQPALYQFTLHDFPFPPGNLSQRARPLQVTFTFRDDEPGEHPAPRYRALSDPWQRGSDGWQRFIYRLRGDLDAACGRIGHRPPCQPARGFRAVALREQARRRSSWARRP